MPRSGVLSCLLIAISILSGIAPGYGDDNAGYIWWEAEDAKSHTFPAGGPFAPQGDKEADILSGGAWLQAGKGAGLRAEWEVDIPEAGEYNFWVRKFWHHGPFSWAFNEQQMSHCGKDCVLADEVQMRRFVCANWVNLGRVTLPAGKNELRIVVDNGAEAVAFDCFLLTRQEFVPDGRNKPGEKYNRTESGWFPFEPNKDDFSANALFDLRRLNQEYAGIDGPIAVNGEHFVYAGNGQRVRFWAVNSVVPATDKDADYLAAFLAKRGVNMVRIHSPIIDKSSTDPRRVDMPYLDRIHYFVNALKKQGIYSKLSFYFPLWFKVDKNWDLPGYDGARGGDDNTTRPYGLIYFHPAMQEIYKAWAKTMLQTKNPYSGLSMAEDPAVAIVEAVNEDGLFFWTFAPYKNPNAECMEPLEKLFGAWLVRKYGSIENARKEWGAGNMPKHPDSPENGRVAFYENTGFLGGFDWARQQRNEKRASDQLQFMVEAQRGFYTDITAYFKNDLGFKGLVSASNWHTVDDGTIGALEKYTYMASDIIDRHGYFGGKHEGDAASWSVQAGNTYVDKSGLLVPDSLSAETLYGGKPHIVSEFNYTAPNRFRAEGAFVASMYASLNGTDGIFFFRVHQANWSKMTGKFSVMSPVIMGQFPAMALAYRKEMLQEGTDVARVTLALNDLYSFKGSAVAQPQHLDELRKKDIPADGVIRSNDAQPIDPLSYYVGKVRVDFADRQQNSELMDITKYIDRNAKTIRSSTGELFWDWGKGVLKVDAPLAQGACGFLGEYGEVALRDMTVKIGNDYASVMAVSLDGKPLRESAGILLQVVSEEKNYQWQTSGSSPLKIDSIGLPPIIVREISGTVTFTNAGASKTRVWTLDVNGNKGKEIVQGDKGALTVLLEPNVFYYFIERE